MDISGLAISLRKINIQTFIYFIIIIYLFMDKNRCVKCGSTQTRVRLSTSERVCIHCGHIEKIVENYNS